MTIRSHRRRHRRPASHVLTLLATAASLVMAVAVAGTPADAAVPGPPAASPAAAPATAPTRYLDEVFGSVTETTGVTYGQATNYDTNPIDLKLDLYQPAGDTETNRPLLVYIHGGYFAAGDKTEGANWARMAAKRGYVAASINYRIWPGAATDLAKLSWAMAAAQHDAQTALRYLRSQATTLGINPVAVATIGYSAGAITSLNVNYRAFDAGDATNPGYALDVAAAASLAGSAIQLTPGAPPIIMFNGTNDTVVPFGASQKTCTDTVAMGNECAQYTYPTGHDLSAYFSDIFPKIWSFFYAELTPHLAEAASPAGYHPIAPTRVLDTRDGTGTGGSTAPVGAGQAISLKATGAGGVPASGVGAVVLNVTGIGAGADTHVTVWPAGVSRPTASNLNLAAGQTAANLVTTGVGAGGAVQLFNNAGTVHLAADVVGWYDTNAVTGGGGRVVTVAPARLLDTRTGLGGPSGPLGPGEVRDLAVASHGGVPADATAAVVNLTAVDPDAATHLTMWPGATPDPGTSNLNVPAGQTRPNLAIVPIGSDGAVRIRNNAGHVHVLADVTGYVTGAATGNRFVPVTPTRVLDTRNGTGGTFGPVNGGQTVPLRIRSAAGLPPAGIAGVVLNVTAVNPTAATHVTVWPGGSALPATSSLNLAAGTVAPNLVMVGAGPDGDLSLFNNAGGVDLVADVVGYLV